MVDGRVYSLRIQMWDQDEEYAEARYESFKVGPRYQDFPLTLDGFSSTGPHRILDSFAVSSNGSQFSAQYYDRDQESTKACTSIWKTSGWIYHCSADNGFDSNLFGSNLQAKQVDYGKGIFWRTFRGTHTSLLKVTMSIKAHDDGNNFNFLRVANMTPLGGLTFTELIFSNRV